MKVAVKKIDALKRELKFEVPKDRVVQKMEEVYKELGKVAKVRGFRKGKVPRSVLEAEHGALAKEETIKKIIPEVYQEGIEQESLLPLDLPEIQDVDFKDGAITFTAHIDIKPDVKINKYKGVTVKRKDSQVTDEEVQKTLDYFKKSQGADKDVEIDDAFAHGLGYPSLDAFKQSLVRQMEIDKDRQNRADIEDQIVNALLKESKLSVPQGLVKKQLEHRVADTKNRLQSQGVPEEDIKKREEEIRKDLQKTVEKDVKVYLVFDKIAELENITVGQGENLPAKVMEFLMKEAEWKEGK
ncbi:MAG: hypothetical protein KAJ18_04605 [Candidatus Omnitrophica bacterium]|nr:hypothetical protein [Candidatus Omnitrophota bacterium]